TKGGPNARPRHLAQTALPPRDPAHPAPAPRHGGGGGGVHPVPGERRVVHRHRHDARRRRRRARRESDRDRVRAGSVSLLIAPAGGCCEAERATGIEPAPRLQGEFSSGAQRSFSLTRSAAFPRGGRVASGRCLPLTFPAPRGPGRRSSRVTGDGHPRLDIREDEQTASRNGGTRAVLEPPPATTSPERRRQAPPTPSAG